MQKPTQISFIKCYAKRKFLLKNPHSIQMVCKHKHKHKQRSFTYGKQYAVCTYINFHKTDIHSTGHEFEYKPHSNVEFLTIEKMKQNKRQKWLGRKKFLAFLFRIFTVVKNDCCFDCMRSWLVALFRKYKFVHCTTHFSVSLFNSSTYSREFIDRERERERKQRQK